MPPDNFSKIIKMETENTNDSVLEHSTEALIQQISEFHNKPEADRNDLGKIPDEERVSIL